MHTHNSTIRALSTTLFVRLALTIAALGLVKVLGIAIEAGPRQAPWGFLLIFVLPFAAGPLFLRRHRRTVTAITGLFSAVLATTCAVVIVRGHIEQSVMDYVVVYVGGPAAAVLTVLSARLFQRPRLDVRHVQGSSPTVR